MKRLVAVLAMLVVVTAVGTAPATAAEADLTAEQRERFITGAQETQGWTKAEAEAVLRDHPDQVPGVVIEIRPKTVVGINGAGWTPNLCLIGDGIFDEIFYFCMKRYWTWDGVKVTYAPGPTVTGTCTNYGKLLGCQYHGIVGSSSHWVYSNGQAHGSHYQFRQGHFSGCIPPLQCHEYPWRSIKVKWNGTYVTGAGW